MLPTSSHRALVIAAILFPLLLAIYVASPVRTSYDSGWSIPTAMSFLRGQGGDLAKYAAARQPDYRVAKIGERYHTLYPIGVSLLSVPAVAIMSWVDPTFEESLQRNAPDKLEMIVASVYGALASVLFFWLIFIRFESIPVALTSTLIFSLCTSMWSTATRALWQHGPLVLMLIAAMLLLLHARRRPALAQYISLPLAMAFVIRPSAAIPIVVFSVYVLMFYRPWFLRFLLWAALIAVPWLAFNAFTWGSLLPPYYLLPWRIAHSLPLAEALLGNLISPARGLFIFSPVLIFAFTGALLALKNRHERPMHIAFGLIVILHWLVMSHSPQWWAGYSFGPRFMTDVVPFLVYFVAFNIAWFGTLMPWKRATLITSMAVLAIVSGLIHLQGAIRWGPREWNAFPASVDLKPERLWDWNDLQFLRR